MSKYIIDVGDAYAEYICGKGDMLCLPVRINEFEDNWLNTNIPLTPYTEPDLEQVNAEKDKIYDEARARGYEEGKARGYQEGLFDAWQAARKIANMPYDEEEKAFGSAGWTFIEKHTAAEAIEKIRQYEQESEEIHLGDEVTFLPNNAKGIVSECHVPDVYSDNDKYAVWCGGTMEYVLKQHLAKTGRTFPEIAEVLAKMKEES